MQARYRKPPMFETFVKHLKEISSPDLTWEVRHDSLVCFEKHSGEQHHPSGKFNSVKEIIEYLHMKLMPNECHKETVGPITTYNFNRKDLIDQLNARQSVVGRVMRKAEEINKQPANQETLQMKKRG